MSTTHDIWARQLPSGLDGLPLTSVPIVPLPDDHPDVEFERDMAALARMERQMWIAAKNKDGDPKPAIPDLDLLCDYIPGCDTEHALRDDLKESREIEDAIERWRLNTAIAVEVAVGDIAKSVA
jgi:hypothetical protein